MSRTPHVAVVGAGPKAAALAAKVDVLNRLGFGPLSLTIVEAAEPAASWLGAHGWTTGRESLSTSPAKDVGFPYRSARVFGAAGAAIDRAMLRFSWQQHLVELGRYAPWVDAGAPNVHHRDYGRYVAWALARANAGVRLVRARVTSAELGVDEDRWQLRLDGETVSRLTCDALVVTGPGEPRHLPHDSDATARIFHCDRRRTELAQLPHGRSCDVAVVGSGESAIACALHLLTARPRATVTVYTPGLPMSRAESFLENRVYSDPDAAAWRSHSHASRRDFVRRSDRGVFASQGLDVVAYDERCTFVCGRVLHVAAASGDGGLRVEHVADDGVCSRAHDYVVNCTGFDLLAQLRGLLSPAARSAVERCAGPLEGRPPDDEVPIGWSLEIEGLAPLLHVPGLAAVSQGPGFANLSSLGLLADRIVSALVPLRVNRNEQEGLVERCS